MRRKNPPSARSVKGFIIDAEKREIREARFSGLKDLQKAVGGLITTAHEIHHFDDSGFSMASSYDTVFVDDEGLLKDPQHFFFIEGGHSPFAGNGVVVGVDEEGGTIDALSTKKELEEMVEFASREDVESMYLRPNPESNNEYIYYVYDPEGALIIHEAFVSIDEAERFVDWMLEGMPYGIGTKPEDFYVLKYHVSALMIPGVAKELNESQMIALKKAQHLYRKR